MTQDLEKVQRSERALLDQLSKKRDPEQTSIGVQAGAVVTDADVQTGPDELLENYSEQVVGQRELIE